MPIVQLSDLGVGLNGPRIRPNDIDQLRAMSQASAARFAWINRRHRAEPVMDAGSAPVPLEGRKLVESDADDSATATKRTLSDAATAQDSGSGDGDVSGERPNKLRISASESVTSTPSRRPGRRSLRKGTSVKPARIVRICLADPSAYPARGSSSLARRDGQVTDAVKQEFGPIVQGPREVESTVAPVDASKSSENDNDSELEEGEIVDAPPLKVTPTTISSQGPSSAVGGSQAGTESLSTDSEL